MPVWVLCMCVTFPWAEGDVWPYIMKKVCLGVDYRQALERCWGGISNRAHTCRASHHLAATNIVNLTPLSDARIPHKDAIAITSSCPCDYMAGALGSIIEHFSLHQFSQHTFLFTRSSEGVKIGLL